jgi:hypothetical protein
MKRKIPIPTIINVMRRKNVRTGQLGPRKMPRPVSKANASAANGKAIEKILPNICQDFV